MTHVTDQEFNDEVVALEKELHDGVTAIDNELKKLHAQLDINLAAADKALVEFATEVEKEIDPAEGNG